MIGQDVYVGAEPFLDIHKLFLPAEGVRVVFCYHDTSICIRDERTRSGTCGSIVGLHDLESPCHIDHVPGTIRMFEVRFAPGGFCGLFGISPLEIDNACFDADSIFDNEGMAVEERLNNSTSLEERASILDHFFIERLVAGKSMMYPNHQGVKMERAGSALQLIRERKGRIRVDEIARRLDISRRTLEWQFSHYIGLSVKSFARIIRFQDLLDNISRDGHVSWADFAVAHGYTDQTHMIKEFKSATTITPDLFMKLNGKSFFRMPGILNFIGVSGRQSDFIYQWIQASARLEEYLKAYQLQQNRS